MHMKYFQAIHDIITHYDNILNYIDQPKHGHMLLETWGIFVPDNPAENEQLKAQLNQEREALRYLVSCQMGVTRTRNAEKPSIDTINRCLHRHLDFLETVHGCHPYNVNKHRLINVRKEYKACRHYLFKFSLPAWYEKMPDVILSFANKHPDSII